MLYVTGELNAVFTAEHKKEIKRYLYNHQVSPILIISLVLQNENGWGFHIEGHSSMFRSVLSYIALRLLGEDMTRMGPWLKAGNGSSIMAALLLHPLGANFGYQ